MVAGYLAFAGIAAVLAISQNIPSPIWTFAQAWTKPTLYFAESC